MLQKIRDNSKGVLARGLMFLLFLSFAIWGIDFQFGQSVSPVVVDGEPLQNNWKKSSQVPANTEISDAMSKDLKKRGFTFVGSTICYAFMQAAGLVNDHIVDCYRHGELKRG